MRRREAGKMCAFCHTSLPWDIATPRGERLCERCAKERQKPRHKVYMHYMLRDGWYCQFLESDLKTPLRRKLAFADSDKILELAHRGGASLILEDRHAIAHGIEIGRGGIWLNLTDEQYRKLK